MLGEQIAEERGKVISRKVLKVERGLPTIEVTLQTHGKLLGVEYDGTITYEAEPRPGGWLLGRGQAVLLTKDGEVVTFTASGTGRPKGGLGASWRGCVFFETTSNKLVRANGLCCCFEHEMDGQGNIESRVFEWK